MGPSLVLGNRQMMFTIFIIGDGDGDDVVHPHHGAAPVVALRRPKMHLELLVRLKDRVVVDVDGAVLHLHGTTHQWSDRSHNAGRVSTLRPGG